MLPEEIKIIKLQITSPVSKTINYSGRPAFGVECQLTPERGEPFSHWVHSTRKKDVPEQLERFQRRVAAGEVSHSGQMIITRFSIG